MSLIPIIYTSLALFFSVLFIVVIVSYLSYRSRKNTNPVILEEMKKINNQNTPQPSIAKRPDYAQIQYKKLESYTKQIRRDDPSSILILPENYFRNEQEIKNKTKVVDKEVRQYYQEKKNNVQQKNIRTRTRIEIVNDNKQFQKVYDYKTEYKDSQIKYINDLSQFNILNFYADNSNQDLVKTFASSN